MTKVTKTMNNEKILNELNDKLDYMLDHLEDYTDNDIKSIVNQMNELYPADPMPPCSYRRIIKRFLGICCQTGRGRTYSLPVSS